MGYISSLWWKTWLVHVMALVDIYTLEYPILYFEMQFWCILILEIHNFVVVVYFVQVDLEGVISKQSTLKRLSEGNLSNRDMVPSHNNFKMQGSLAYLVHISFELLYIPI